MVRGVPAAAKLGTRKHLQQQALYKRACTLLKMNEYEIIGYYHDLRIPAFRRAIKSRQERPVTSPNTSIFQLRACAECISET